MATQTEPKVDSATDDSPSSVLANKDDILNTDFCLKVANRIGLEKAVKGLNFVISPTSIHACLSLIAAGSKGATLDQLLSHLKFKNINDLNDRSSQILKLMSVKGEKGSALSFANSVWVDKCFLLKLPFQEIASAAHGAQVKNVDFLTNAVEATKEINSWVETATNGLIKDLIPCISSDTRLVLANALYFLGAWNKSFNGRLTHDGQFHLINEDKVQATFMCREWWDRKELFRSFDGFKVLGLPYKNVLDNQKLAMYFILPDEKNGLKNLVEKLNSDVGFFNQDFRLEEVELDAFQIPKFKISFDFEASETMKELGLDLPFKETAEITEMVVDSGEGLYISKILHRSCVEVNEAGTIAAACTYTDLSGCGLTPPMPEFVADHPFMFMIREETSRMVLFVGNVLDPSAS